QPIRARRGTGVHPDQLAAADLADSMARAVGAPVRVAPKGDGYTVTLTVASHDAAVALAQRLGA
ncbi:MAG: ParB/RepB/Spo0J family partition protein, partial [Solirubrobacteraceae bacterium]